MLVFFSAMEKYFPQFTIHAVLVYITWSLGLSLLNALEMNLTYLPQWSSQPVWRPPYDPFKATLQQP